MKQQHRPVCFSTSQITSSSDLKYGNEIALYKVAQDLSIY